MDTVFFWLSKLLWAVVAPSSLLMILIFATWILLVRSKWRAAKISMTVFCFFVLVISIFPLGKWLLMPLEQQFQANPVLPEQIDGIVVLSGSGWTQGTEYWQQVQLNDASERHLAFMALARKYPNAKLVYTGGSGDIFNAELKQADVAMQLYQSQGFDTSRIIFERQARNTAENALLSHQMIQPDPSENWLLVTTAWHMPRSIGIFCKIGWSMIPYPVDHRTLPNQPFTWRWSFAGNLGGLDEALKEWLGLTAYYVAGKTPELLSNTCLNH